MQGTFTVAGQRVRTSSTRRYVAWVVYRDENDHVTGMSIWKRSDRLGTIIRETHGRAYESGRRFVVIDTTTGEEVR